jgi:hypothetical protein
MIAKRGVCSSMREIGFDPTTATRFIFSFEMSIFQGFLLLG